ncbi:HD family phosphohydrolase [Robiginitalea biformata]|uniref:Putative transmembrane HD family protein n=1 Tax=Robiginitalea biformata (strain ATCC BAA-864 / DSM 15991 / KCTC 12146 / HTCC2501) TaxID=313596 RepID=A4CK46_ROBBH|nr:HDIG domain-containing metalloprotein [Robiginitalea biformata]EAR15245.1 putative transmembrane HD family protein [Robiginitalea biformata HTCC2501]
MAKTLDTFYRSQSLIYKYFLYFLTIGAIVFFFPKGGQFKYEFQKGKPWQYENLYAPFDFSIRKTEAELQAERQQFQRDQVPYYRFDTEAAREVYRAYEELFPEYFPGTGLSARQIGVLRQQGRAILDSLYLRGIWDGSDPPLSREVYLVRNNQARRMRFDSIYRMDALRNTIRDLTESVGIPADQAEFRELLLRIAEPNVSLDQELTGRELENQLSGISLTRGNVDEGALIVAKGEVVEGESLKKLESLRAEYASEVWSANNYYFILSGYTILVALVLIMLLLFLKRYRPDVFRNNVKVTFIFFNILVMVFLTTFVVKYNEALVFVVPLCILPLILKTFFDARLGLFVHVLTVLILGFVVPNSFEYIFLQIIAGIVTILTVSELYKRANLFISVGQITLIYILGYFAFNIIQGGSLDNVVWVNFGFFLLNGMITLFVQPLIYIYEKMFGMVSDVSLLELSDTNSRLLKELSNKAPGTFNHSLQVANLAEAAANEIGANAMLVRVGALYHDIGKMNNPTYFTENQTTNNNPHDELAPEKSARIIIKHVIEGIEMARKQNIPDRIIDFIRTHHGTTLVYYFYKKARERDGEDPDEKDFRYPGPVPFSKETAILMMADSVEAASKSLVNPTYSIIDEFVDKIIATQMQAGQFLNAEITFKEIETVKKVLKQRLTNIYHLRVEYPE